jgi:hypothetical protein
MDDFNHEGVCVEMDEAASRMHQRQHERDYRWRGLDARQNGNGSAIVAAAPSD